MQQQQRVRRQKVRNAYYMTIKGLGDNSIRQFFDQLIDEYRDTPQDQLCDKPIGMFASIYEDYMQLLENTPEGKKVWVGQSFYFGVDVARRSPTDDEEEKKEEVGGAIQSRMQDFFKTDIPDAGLTPKEFLPHFSLIFKEDMTRKMQRFPLPECVKSELKGNSKDLSNAQGKLKKWLNNFFQKFIEQLAACKSMKEDKVKFFADRSGVGIAIDEEQVRNDPLLMFLKAKKETHEREGRSRQDDSHEAVSNGSHGELDLGSEPEKLEGDNLAGSAIGVDGDNGESRVCGNSARGAGKKRERAMQGDPKEFAPPVQKRQRHK